MGAIQFTSAWPSVAVAVTPVGALGRRTSIWVVALPAATSHAAGQGSCTEQPTRESPPIDAMMEVGLESVEADGSAARRPATNGNISHVATRAVKASSPLRASVSSMTPVDTGSAAPRPD
jgi:hypothetical protein